MQFYGAEGARTPDLLGAIQALSQLSYSPDTWEPGNLTATPALLNGDARNTVSRYTLRRYKCAMRLAVP